MTRTLLRIYFSAIQEGIVGIPTVRWRVQKIVMGKEWLNGPTQLH